MVTYLLNGMFLCNGNARSKRVSAPLKHTCSIDRRVVITSGSRRPSTTSSPSSPASSSGLPGAPSSASQTTSSSGSSNQRSRCSSWSPESLPCRRARLSEPCATHRSRLRGRCSGQCQDDWGWRCSALTSRTERSLVECRLRSVRQHSRLTRRSGSGLCDGCNVVSLTFDR